MSSVVEPHSEGGLLLGVETLLSRRLRIPFPDWLERRFEADTGARYATLLSQDLLRTAVYYNLMLAGDFLLTPDTVWVAAALHFAVVTPAMLLVAGLCRLRLRPLARDLAAASVPVLIACQILCVFALSQSWSVSHYLFFVTLNSAAVNCAMRLRLRAATWATSATFLALAVTLAATQKIPIQIEVMQVFSLGVCGIVTLRGMGDREREFRRAYLHTLRDRLKIAASDAEASHDALTGAANRRGLETAVRTGWVGEPTAPVAVILFDLDRFKAYNDLYGHPAGDACLKTIAAAALDLLRDRDAVLARFGGEEFLVLLTGDCAHEAEAIAERLRRTVLALNIVHAGAPERRVMSASFGVARGKIGESGFEALTAAADAALYAAKSAGRNKVNCALAA